MPENDIQIFNTCSVMVHIQKLTNGFAWIYVLYKWSYTNTSFAQDNKC